MSTHINVVGQQDFLALSMSIVEHAPNVARETLQHEPSQNELKIVQKAMLEGATVALGFKRNGSQYVPQRRGRGRPLGSKNRPKEN